MDHSSGILRKFVIVLLKFVPVSGADVLLPTVTGTIGWLAGRRKQKNDFLAEMQSSIDLLSEKNCKAVI